MRRAFCGGGTGYWYAADTVAVAIGAGCDGWCLPVLVWLFLVTTLVGAGCIPLRRWA